ncbi:MAG: hypothetical protein COA79_20145 [Planctomycetota bacterium]|nr:MAG: hypothetical protein COA79_20145 [Planctomycetota bacterium]
MSDQNLSKAGFTKFRKLVEKETPWSVDRFGRLFAGLGTLIFTILGLSVSTYFLIPVLLINLNLIITSFSDKCAMRNMLKNLGAEERERIYRSDGTVKPEKLNDENIHPLAERV